MAANAILKITLKIVFLEPDGQKGQIWCQFSLILGSEKKHDEITFLVPMLTASGTYAVLRACVCMYVCVYGLV